MDLQTDNKLRRDAIGVSHIVFFVVAAAAPLTAVVGASPAAFAFGNGPGVPASYLLVGLLYLVFSVGFTAMNRFVSGAGGFYSYIANGLGRPAGVAGAFIALITYNAIDIAVYGLFGFFLNDIVKSMGGPDVPWLLYSLLLAIAVYLCGMRKIEFSGKVLGCCMVAEIAILMLLGLAILMTGGGPEGISVSAFGPQAVFTPGLGVALVFVVASFIGFEATAIFGEEARDPKRTIPKATYLAVLIIALFYAFVTWTISLHYGPSKITEVAATQTATMYLSAVQSKLGGFAGFVMNVLLVTSLFACALSFHNTINRYFYAIGREGIAWAGFARTHDDHQSPYVAGIVQTALAFGITAIFALTGQDPYAVVFAWMGTFASIGILILQILVSLAVIVFFARDNRGISLWHRLVAPVIGALGLASCLALMIANLSLVSGSESLIVDSFPLVIVLVGGLGFVFANWLRTARPTVYENLGRAFG
ncbi:APC family permease [Jiella sp. MQZ9-1]|uniref:APC family permease n=1 Tax=Jiella flava TaxID=2816857 RepID=A0A939FZJ7_9HYPH|nr:APC family permease [Jiella flava]MBO0663729.1 APC family permease [Jiella flava]MCD2472301.1 APC family permease [Jiella flava]